jgi:2-methylcitrate dehydratase PrpD
MIGMTSQTQILADYVAGGKFEDLPSEVVAHAKRCVMDTISCGLGGRKTRDADILIKTLKEIGGPPEATVFWERTKLSFIHAAQVNRFLANILDYDDAYMKVGHMTIVLVPVALALGERLHSTGKEIINAVVHGYEAIIRIRNALEPTREAYVTTFERVDSGTAFGVTVVAGKLLGLNGEQMADAFGLTGFARASRVTYPDRATKGMPSWMKITCGDSLIPGIHSALLAKNGVSGDRHVLDQGTAYGLVVGSDRYDASELTRKLGEEYGTLRIGFKFYPACRYTSAAIDAATAIVSENSVNVDDIDRIIVRGSKNLATFFQIYEPKHIIEAEFSIPYVITMALTEKPRAVWYSDETMKDPKLRELQHKVSVEEDPVATQKFLTFYVACATVEMTMKGGRVLSRHVDYPKGEPENPFSDEDHRDKFNWMASHVGMNQAQKEELLRRLDRFEELDNVSELTALLVP